MTIITNRRAVIIILVLLAFLFLYLSFSEGIRLRENKEVNQMVGMEDAVPIEVVQLNRNEKTPDNLENSLAGDEFFMEYRLERDRRRAQEIELLQSMFNSPDAANEIRHEAQQKLLEITNFLDQELTLETLIMAKGYADAIAFIQAGQVTVVVRDGEFDQEDATRIADLVSRTTGFPLSKITIIAKS